MSSEDRTKTWQHAANNWADVAYNGLQWLKNIEDGITADVKEARENMERCCNSAKATADAVYATQASPQGFAQHMELYAAYIATANQIIVIYSDHDAIAPQASTYPIVAGVSVVSSDPAKTCISWRVSHRGFDDYGSIYVPTAWLDGFDAEEVSKAAREMNAADA